MSRSCSPTPRVTPSEDEASRLEGDLIDLEPLLRDQVVLDLPFQPVCWPDCAGLCADCGANLNENPEHEHSGSIDPRWAELAAPEVDEDDEPGIADGASRR